MAGKKIARRETPDGKTLICLFIDEQFNPPKRRGAVVSFDNGDFLKTFDLPPGKRSYGGSPDGKSQIYTASGNGVENVWSQPIHGGPPKQLTDFNPDLDSNVIYKLAWSHDGRRMALVRGKISTDIVVIKDFR